MGSCLSFVTTFWKRPASTSRSPLKVRVRGKEGRICWRAASEGPTDGRFQGGVSFEEVALAPSLQWNFMDPYALRSLVFDPPSQSQVLLDEAVSNTCFCNLDRLFRRWMSCRS